jgi:hypothetical protein
MPKFYQPTMPSQPSQMMPTMGYQQQQQQPNFYQNQPQLMQQQQQPTQFYQANQFQQPQLQQQQQQQMPPVNQQVLREPTPVLPVEKGPLPSEHQIIQDTFDSLLKSCLYNSNMPIVKRKLDDVAKKLDILYDKLRDTTV